MSAIIKVYDEEYAFRFIKCNYQNNGNLAIVINVHDEEYDFWEQYDILTVNIDGNKLADNQIYLDTNNIPKDIINWMFSNGYATEIGVGFGGFCSYPLVELSNGFMELILESEE